MSSWKHSGRRQPFVVEEHKTTTNDRHTDDSRYQQLYSAPTVDTLETQNSLIRPYTSDTDTLNALSEGRNNNEASNVQSNKKRGNEKEFQIPEDSMAVFVRDIAVAQRSAFAMRKPPLPSDITTLNPKKISPSMQHLSLIHQLQSITHTRQLAFTPSVGLSADSLSPEAFNFSISSSSSTKRDGRYRSIDPVKATLDVLPHTPPLLSNKKWGWRLRAAFRSFARRLLTGFSGLLCVKSFRENTSENHTFPLTSTAFHVNLFSSVELISMRCPCWVGRASALAPSKTAYSPLRSSLPEL